MPWGGGLGCSFERGDLENVLNDGLESGKEALNRHNHQNESHETKQDLASTGSNQVEHWLGSNKESKRDAYRGKRGTNEEHLLNDRLSFGHLEHCAGHGSRSTDKRDAERSHCHIIDTHHLSVGRGVTDLCPCETCLKHVIAHNKKDNTAHDT